MQHKMSSSTLAEIETSLTSTDCRNFRSYPHPLVELGERIMKFVDVFVVLFFVTLQKDFHCNVSLPEANSFKVCSKLII